MPIRLPESCPRHRKDCEPLSQIIDDEEGGFICCGTNDGTTRELEQDIFRVCWKNEAIDEMSDWDWRDIIDTVSVFMQAMSVMKNRECCQRIYPPDQPKGRKR